MLGRIFTSRSTYCHQAIHHDSLNIYNACITVSTFVPNNVFDATIHYEYTDIENVSLTLIKSYQIMYFITQNKFRYTIGDINVTLI